MTSHEGIIEIVADEQALVDVVFVHGIGQRWERTWSGEDPSKTWLRTLLPRELPRSRILTFGFNVLNRGFNADWFRERSQGLIEGLTTLRTTSIQSRPILFLAHSLGCLILEAALTSPDAAAIRGSICGIMFFAPPHFGDDVDAWQSFGEHIVKTVQGLELSPTQFKFQDFGKVNEEFDERFKQDKSRYSISCFYEQYPLHSIGALIVPKGSVHLPDSQEYDIGANHLRMTKFENSEDPRYMMVVQRMKVLMKSRSDPTKTTTPVLDPLPGNPQEQASTDIRNRQEWSRQSTRRLRDSQVSAIDEREEVFKTGKVTSLARVAIFLDDQGHYAKSEKAYQRAIEEYEKDPYNNERVLLYCKDRFSGLMRCRGAYQKAFEISSDVLNQRRRKNGLNHLATLSTCGNMALIMRHQDRHQDAFLLLRQALESTERMPFEAVSSIRLVSILASLLKDCSEYGLAELLSRDAAAASDGLAKLLSQDNAATSPPYSGKYDVFALNRLVELSSSLSCQGRKTTAEEVAYRALDGLEKSLGRNHPYALLAGRAVGNCHRIRGDLAEAAHRLESVVDGQTRHLSSDHPDTLASSGELAAVYILQGFVGEGLQRLQQTNEKQKLLLGSDHPHTLWTAEALRLLELVPEGDKDNPTVWQRTIEDMSEPVLNAVKFLKAPARIERHIRMTAGLLFWQDQPLSSGIRAILADDVAALNEALGSSFENTRLLGQALRIAAASRPEPLKAIRWLLDHGAPINGRGGYYGTALQAASQEGHANVVRELLARKADVNAQGGIFGTPLRAAALRGFEEVVSLLLKNGADPNIAPDDLCNVLQIAISRGRTELVHRLLEPDCEERDPGTESLGPQKVLTADPNAKDELFGSPLQEACAYGKEKIVRVLLDHGADAFSEGGIYKNASMAALKNGHEDVLYYLIEHNIAAVPYAMTLQRQRLTRKSSTQVIVPYEKVPLPNVDRAPKRQGKTSAPKKLGIQSKKQIKRLHRRLQKCVKWNYPH